MTDKEYQEIMKKYRFDDYIKAEANKLTQKRMCIHWKDEIESEGYMGLLQGLKLYDKSFGGNTDESNSFVAYITKFISGYMMKGIDNLTRVVRIPTKIIYMKNRDFDIVETTYDINDEYFDQPDPITEDILSNDFFEQDENWLANKAIYDVLDKLKRTDRIGKQKAEAFKMFHQLGENKNKIRTLKEISKITQIDTETIRKSNNKILIDLNKQFIELKNKLIMINKRNGIQHIT